MPAVMGAPASVVVGEPVGDAARLSASHIRDQILGVSGAPRGTRLVMAARRP